MPRYSTHVKVPLCETKISLINVDSQLGNSYSPANILIVFLKTIRCKPGYRCLATKESPPCKNPNCIKADCVPGRSYKTYYLLVGGGLVKIMSIREKNRSIGADFRNSCFNAHCIIDTIRTQRLDVSCFECHVMLVKTI